MPTAENEPGIEKLITNVITRTLGVIVLSFERIAKGEVNKVYKVTTAQGNVLLRIFKKKGWVSKKKVEWIEKELTKHKVPHAKLLHFSGGTTYFPYGFMITEFIEGQNCSDAISAGKLSFDDFHKKLGAQIRKVHHIHTPGYGDIPNPSKTKSFLKYALGTIGKTFAELKAVPEINTKLQLNINQKLTALLSPLEHKLRPTLTHGDPGPDNCILNKKGQVVLIDWDAAKASAWVRDYADLRLSGAHMTHVAPLEERRTRIAKAFLQTHTKLGLTSAELEQIEAAFHILISANSLSYYYNFQKNMGAYKKNLERLQTLL